MENFTPIQSLLGGMMIGLAALALMAVQGKIAGISGILSGGLLGSSDGRGWRLGFLAGLIAAVPLWVFATGSMPQITMSPSWLVLVLGGLLVGFGTRFGSGCTSGHGVCGIGRLSKRSIVATCLFMGSAVVTTFITRHLIGI